MLYESRLDRRTDEEAPFDVAADPELALKGGVWQSAEASHPTTTQERVTRGWRGDVSIEHFALTVKPVPQVRALQGDTW